MNTDDFHTRYAEELADLAGTGTVLTEAPPIADEHTVPGQPAEPDGPDTRQIFDKERGYNFGSGPRKQFNQPQCEILVVEDGSAYNFSAIRAIERLDPPEIKVQFRDGFPAAMFLPGITIYKSCSIVGHHIHFETREKRDAALSEYVRAWVAWKIRSSVQQNAERGGQP